MPNSYTYVDPDHIYTDPQTGVLRNIGNITDNETLQFAEAGATARRSQEFMGESHSDHRFRDTFFHSSSFISGYL